MNVNSIAQANSDIREARKIIDAQVLVTETGDARNYLADANIHLMAAATALDNAITTAKDAAHVR